MFKYLTDFLIYDLLNLSAEDKLVTAVHFFIYDVTKILALIVLVVLAISYLRTFLPIQKIKAVTSKSKFGMGNVLASVFGAVTPFCSCSSIPIFIGFVKARIPAGIAFSFLVTSPLVNEIAFVIMGGLFGWHLAILYALTGIVLGVVAGLILGALDMEKDFVLEDAVKDGKGNLDDFPQTLSGRAKFAWQEASKTFKKLLPYVTGGVAIGAAIHGYVPAEFFEKYIGNYGALSVPVAVLIGIPIYAGCSTIVPVIFSITASGAPLGTSLAFMMSIAGLSLPEMVILKKVLRGRLLAIFVGIVAVGITAIGYLFNLVG